MDSDRSSGNADKPGAFPSDFDERTAARGSETAPPVQSSATPDPAAQSDQRPHLTVQVGGSRSITGAAQRIGSALGWSAAADAHRRLRHGLEVVGADSPLHSSDQPRPGPQHANSGRAEDPFEDDIAARMMHEIENAVAELRRDAAGRLISLQRPNKPPSQRTDPCGLAREVYDFLVRIQQRARRLAAEKPIETAAALVAVGVAFGAALHLRKSR